jgi:hypothetical protein
MITMVMMKIESLFLPAAEEVRSVEELVLARALEECLEAMERGETDLDELSSRYPEAHGKIRPLLEIAQQLRRRRGLSAPLSLEFREKLGGLLSQRGTS